jgi:Formaldehyde-activating enzyme (Fae)
MLSRGREITGCVYPGRPASRTDRRPIQYLPHLHMPPLATVSGSNLPGIELSSNRVETCIAGRLFTSLLAVVAPNLMVKPAAVMFNKVTIKNAKQAVQMFGPAQHAVAKAVADSVAESVIPREQADDLFICVGVFIHWGRPTTRRFKITIIAP